MIHVYGWRPDVPDQRDLAWSPPMTLGELPAVVDLRPQMPAVYDQGNLGSCTANAIGALLEYARMRAALPAFVPSRLFIYYEERKREGTIASDAGAMIRDGMKVVAQQGAPPEALWPYAVARFAEQPPPAAYAAALHDRALQYARVSRPHMQACLAAGNPIVIGFSVYESFESDAVAQTGDAPMPAHSEQLLGGHAVLVVGYDDAAQRWLLRNSWGASWGKAGYFTLPYAYLHSRRLTSDFWTLTRIGA